MDVSYLIQVLQRKEIILSNAKAQAFSVGDLDGMNTVDQELLQTQNTLIQLNLLAAATAAAIASNQSTADVIANGVNATQNTVQGPSASAIINGFDVSAYATDPLYEQKIMNILASMPIFTNAQDITGYIQGIAPGSPVTGEMILAAASQYNIDQSLLIAIIQNDSQFGTQGIGAQTNNPGNVGNTGYATQSYPSWSEGVGAVAEWLSRHRVSVPAADTSAPAVVSAPVATPTVEPTITVPTATTSDATSTPVAAVTTTTPDASTTPDIAVTASSTDATSTNATTTDTTSP